MIITTSSNILCACEWLQAGNQTAAAPEGPRACNCLQLLAPHFCLGDKRGLMIHSSRHTHKKVTKLGGGGSKPNANISSTTRMHTRGGDGCSPRG